MTTPIDDGDVIVPLHLQPVVTRPQGWRGRSNRLVAVGLIAFVAVAIVLGTAFDDGQPSRSAPIAVASGAASSPTAGPTLRPTPSPEPLATRLPNHQVLGDELPTEERLVLAAGLERLDLATGVLTQVSPLIDYSAQPLPNGDIVCACVVRDFAANDGTGSSALRFGRYDRTGTPIVETDLLSFDGVVAIPEIGDGFNVASTLGPDGDVLYVLVVERRPPVWTIRLLAVDVDTGDLVRDADVDRVPVDLDEPTPSPSPSATPRSDGSPPDGIHLWGSGLAVAPGGRSAYVAVDRSEIRDSSWTWQTSEWTIDFESGKSRTSRPLPPGAALEPNSGCLNEPNFIDADLLVRVCTAPLSGTVGVRRIGRNGASLGEVPIVSAVIDGSSPLSVVVNRSQRAVFVWDLQQHALIRVDVDDGRVQETVVPESMRPNAGRPTGSRGFVGGNPGVVQSPDGRFLYALGVNGAIGGTGGAPSGIWVFDAESLELVDRWEPRAYLSSLAVSKDGRFVYAVGVPGVDVNGFQNPWPASLTVYDAVTGEIQLIHGSVAPDSWITFVPGG